MRPRPWWRPRRGSSCQKAYYEGLTRPWGDVGKRKNALPRLSPQTESVTQSVAHESDSHWLAGHSLEIQSETAPQSQLRSCLPEDAGMPSAGGIAVASASLRGVSSRFQVASCSRATLSLQSLPRRHGSAVLVLGPPGGIGLALRSFPGLPLLAPPPLRTPRSSPPPPPTRPLPDPPPPPTRALAQLQDGWMDGGSRRARGPQQQHRLGRVRVLLLVVLDGTLSVVQRRPIPDPRPQPQQGRRRGGGSCDLGGLGG